jgi:hypothetical protein
MSSDVVYREIVMATHACLFEDLVWRHLSDSVFFYVYFAVEECFSSEFFDLD